MQYHPRLLKWLLNCWPPFIGAGIHVKYIAPDFRSARVEMPLRWYNQNILRVHFGGSLYAMTDPFCMLMVMAHLGKTHYVWDKTAQIEFIAPGRRRVWAEFALTEADLQRMRSQTADGQKYFHSFTNEVRDVDGVLVATVKKVIYVKRKKQA